jgi:beta-glucosidase
MSAHLSFPAGFVWGVATSSYQFEGAANEDGKGPSIWDTFTHLPGTTYHGDTGDVACDHYHRIDSDADLMAELGIPTCRFSLSWPRIQSEGQGPVNQAGLDHYRRLVDVLLARDIVPMVTLYHWDLPQALEARGGWLSRETVARFGEYARVVAAALGDRVMLWTTINEPWVAAFIGYADGSHAPGRREIGAGVTAAHHLLLAHGVAAGEIAQTAAAGARVGVILNLAPVSAATSSDDDVAAAQRVDAHLNRGFLDPVLLGRYPDELVEEYSRLAGPGVIREEDLAVIRAGADFLGVNYYTRRRVAADPGWVPDHSPEAARRDYGHWLGATEYHPPRHPCTTKGWTIDPDGLTELLVRLRNDYGEAPLYVTENGAAFADYVDPSGAVRDPERIDFLARHLSAVHAAIVQGVDVRGYLVWSLLDNFEWADGYSQRFGLVFVDFGTQRRIPKSSAYWFREVIAENGLDIPETTRS